MEVSIGRERREDGEEGGATGFVGALRVIVADDEQLARRRARRLLGALPDVEVVAECVDGREVLAALARADVDVALLDIRMPKLSGLEARAMIPEDGPYVIFTTAHAEHALEAFEVGAVDYILKPITAARLATALARARRAVAGARAAASAARAPRPDDAPLDRLAVPTTHGIVLLDPSSISHALFDGALVTLHTDQGPVLTDMSLQELSQRLAGASFERVHRRALLNLNRVARLEPRETGGLVARTDRGADVPISRQVARRLRRRLGVRA